MIRSIISLFFLLLFSQASAQQQLGKLTVEKIMRDPRWMGTSPSNLQWSNDGQQLYFSWNPENNLADSTYFITLSNKVPAKATVAQKQDINFSGNFVYNLSRSAFVYSKDGDVFYTETKTGKTGRNIFS